MGQSSFRDAGRVKSWHRYMANPSPEKAEKSSTDQPNNQPTNEAIDKPINQSINQPINRQSRNQLLIINRASNQPTNQAGKQAIEHTHKKKKKKMVKSLGAAFSKTKGATCLPPRGGVRRAQNSTTSSTDWLRLNKIQALRPDQSQLQGRLDTPLFIHGCAAPRCVKRFTAPPLL